MITFNNKRIKNMNAAFLTDGYKTGHHLMYPEGTSVVYSNFTPRSNKRAPQGINQVVAFGMQMVVRQLKELFNEDFFSQDKDAICKEIKEELSMYLNTDYDVTHFEKLHELGYLPIIVKGLPEGTLVPIGVPVLTIYNTLPEFYWITNYLETIISNLLWKPITSATIAYEYKKNLTRWARKTDEKALDFVNFQCHDFSMRGMVGVESVVQSGLGHATSFLGSDSLPVIHGARKFYDEKGFVIGSVNATEHSVMCAGTKEDEVGTFRNLMKTFPKGVLSVVSDTWSLWTVLSSYLPELKEEILARDGKLVIRPDSGDPVDIICGTWDGAHVEEDRDNFSAEEKGVIELLWDIFGGTTNEQGYKVLDSHIGAIYGDSITLSRAESICKRLEAKGFASTNIVLGIGSFTYQYNTRDTFGFAMKATWVTIDDKGREIFKQPVTDTGEKNSAKGLLKVELQDGKYILREQQTKIGEASGELQTIFSNGDLLNPTTLTKIRYKLSITV